MIEVVVVVIASVVLPNISVYFFKRRYWQDCSGGHVKISYHNINRIVSMN